MASNQTNQTLRSEHTAGGGISMGSVAPAELVLKAACERCGAASGLYATSCRHTTLCSDCGMTLALARGRCTVCSAPVTRLIRVRYGPAPSLMRDII